MQDSRYNENDRDSGIWAASTLSGGVNRIFRGLDNDPEHATILLTPRPWLVKGLTDVDILSVTRTANGEEDS